MAPPRGRARSSSLSGLRSSRPDAGDLVAWLTGRLHKDGLPTLAIEEVELLHQADDFPSEWQRLTGEAPPEGLWARMVERLRQAGRMGDTTARSTSEVSGLVFLKASAEGDVRNMSNWLETKERLRLLRAMDEHGRSAIHLAAGAGHTEVLKLLYGHGADMDRRDRRGRTALLLAAEYGWAPATEVLLDCGCVPGTADRKGRTALHLAVCCEDPRVCRLLVERNQYLVDRRDVHSRTPIFHSVLNVNPQALAEATKLLLEKKAEVNARDCYGMVPLHYAAQEDRLAAVQLLLRYKADPTIEDRVNGRTPIHLACSQGVRRVLEEAAGAATPCADAAAGSMRPGAVQLGGPFHALQSRFIQIMRRVQEGGIQQMEHVKRPHLFTGSWMAPVSNHQQLLGQALKYLPGPEVCIRVFNLLYPAPSLPAPRGDEGDILRYFGDDSDRAQWGGDDPYAGMAIGPEDAAAPAYRGELLRKMQEQRHLLEEKETLIEELRRTLGKMQVQLADCIEPETAKVLRTRAAKAQAELLSVSEDLAVARNRAAELEGQNRVLQEKLDEEKARGDALLADHLALRRQLDDELMRRGEEQSWHLLFEREQHKAAELEKRLQAGEADAAGRASSVAMLEGEVQRLKLELTRQVAIAEEAQNAERRRQQMNERQLRHELESAQQETAQQAALREAEAMSRLRAAELQLDTLRRDAEKADRLRIDAEKALSTSKTELKEVQAKLDSRDQHWQSMIDKYGAVANMLIPKKGGTPEQPSSSSSGAAAPPPPQPPPKPQPQQPPPPVQKASAPPPPAAPQGQAKKVWVTILSARGLRDADSMIGMGTSDPYCMCGIAGKPKLKKIRTKTINNTVTPEWNHSDVLDGYQDGDALEFEVYDSDTANFDDLLGKVQLTPAMVAQGYDGELPLADAGKGVQAYLKVQVSLTPPGAGEKQATTAQQVSTRKVWVTILSARGLRDADSMLGMGTSDPYCMCGIAGKPKLKKIRTKTINNTVTPEWNHSDVLDGYQDGDALEFEVYDSDTANFDDSLGKVRLSGANIAHGFQGELELMDAGKGVQAFLKVQVSLTPPGAGDKQATTVQERPTKKVWVTIFSARGLRDADSMPGMGTSDPYCMCSIAGKPKLKKIKTKTIDNTVTPEWNHSDVLDGYQDGDGLEFEVYDSDTGKSDDLLGKVRLAPGDIARGFNGELPLAEAGKGIQAFLKVQVSLTPPGEGQEIKPTTSAEQVKTRKVWVTIFSARGLRDADSMPGMGTSDPYCMCGVAGKAKLKKIRTKTIDNTVTPEWNHSEVLEGYQDGDALEFVVYDSDTANFDDVLGKVRLSGADVASGFNGELPLTDAGKGIEAFLKVQVSLSPPGAGEKPLASAQPIQTKKVWVTIFSARGLRDADIMPGMGTSDPYCLCSISGKPKLKKIRTKTIDNTVTPEWNHSEVLDGYEDGDGLEFEVYDSDTGKSDDLLGKVRLAPSDIAQGFNGELPLAEAGKGIQAFLKVQVSLTPPGAGEKPATSVQAPKPKKLWISIVSARGLRDADSMPGMGTSDPYCICSVVSKPKLKKIKTKTIDNTVTPEWNHSETLDGYEEGDALEFEVYDSDTGKTDDFLGKARLSAPEISKGFEGELPLADAGKGVEAYIRIKVSSSPPTGAVTKASVSEASAPKAAPVAPAPSPAESKPTAAPKAAGAPVAAATPAQRAVHVMIISASGLRDADKMPGTGVSDPYCICSITGKPKAKKERTKTINDNLNPVWNHSFTMDGLQEGVDGLQFEVYDEDIGGSADFLGRASLPWADIAKGFVGSLPLSDAGKGIQASLKVQVNCDEPTAKAAGAPTAAAASSQLPAQPPPQQPAAPQGPATPASQAATPGAVAKAAPVVAQPGADGGKGKAAAPQPPQPSAPQAPAAAAADPGSAPASQAPPAKPKYKVSVTIESAKNLHNADGWGGKSDPYCECEIQGKPASKFKTPHINDNNNPTWNHEGAVEDFEDGDVLVFNVFDYDPAIKMVMKKGPDFLGKAQLSSQQVLQGFDSELPLESPHKEKATLKIKVKAQ